ncbi:probable folate-biopterin transporter 4 [Telopea speciosissima]|uniref:probable folate-biopterin transporter 4 n=1 Tax=Telopea speciosissima TaxID=54955 RepID=UPI001CC4F536|nr:probable folate-biopterin transporter 4 [Telopea speciosissima]
MIVWLKQLQAAYGFTFLWLISLVYFIQGFRSFVWTAVSYQLKDNLNLSPSASQLVFSVSFFPWSIKPLYGIVSDCIPIRGRKRIPYLVISTILSLFPWLILGLKASLRSYSGPLMIILTVQNLGSAMTDVVVDAMIAEAVRCDRAAFAGDLQSMSWLAMAVGGICGSLLGGFALTNLQIETIFLLFSILPAMQLLSCGLVEEDSLGVKGLLELSNSRSSHREDRNGSISDSDDSSVKNSKASTTRRKKSHKNSKKRKFISTGSETLQKDGSLAEQWFQSLKSAIYSLCRAFGQPIILRPMTWFFLAHVTVPNLSSVMFYYQTEFLNLDASFLGTSRIVGWLGLMVGTFIFNRFMRNMKLRRILMLAHVGLAILSLLDIALVSRVNVSFGISDKIMVLCGSALADAVNQFKFMPFLILSGQLCPPGIEGTLFALFMSINNLGSTLGSFVGAGLASVLNISSGSFDNLLLGIFVQVICIFIPIGFLFLIPKEAIGITA